ncbi:MAG: hypothetical protein EU548_05615 [Promethearchaeota archaeon]|nr:MAG: hypothetical protein EU548_05615 [Candidatus Lokiarchaeota archaeon]
MIQNELWNESYKNRINRNIGHLTFKEQEIVRTSRIAILGVGGLGGILTELLVRTGCQSLVICDKDVYEESNLNRQLCTKKDLGKFKVDHLKDHLIQIDPELTISKAKSVTSRNIDSLLEDVHLVCLTLDDPVASILIARKCREKGIPLLESWGIPYLWAWWFTSNSIDYETCYHMDTWFLNFQELEKSDLRSHVELFPKLIQFPEFKEIYDREKGYFEKMKSGEIPYRSFAPFVHLTASYLAVF